MEIIISEIDKSSIKALNKCDSAFVVDSRLILHYENGRLSYTVASMPKYTKRYEPQNLDYSTYINNPEKTAFIAYADSKPIGQIIIRKNWNRFALIEDIRVDVNFRRRGIGKALIECGERWARQKGFPGFMVETQDSNVGACCFYEKYGFVLGGLDTQLYRAGALYTDDIALFWYLVFDKSGPPRSPDPSLGEVMTLLSQL